MKKMLFFFLALMPALFFGADQAGLKKKYREVCQAPSDINEHIPVLCILAKECSSVVEIGVRQIVSTWGLLQGLASHNASNRSYLGIDLVTPPEKALNQAKKLAEKHGIGFRFWQADDLTIDLPETDLLFIDSLHTYCHLMTELERFSPRVRKFIALHDTSGPWGEVDDSEYKGDYSEYSMHLDRTKRGLWAAVVDFLTAHPEWSLRERRLNNNGLTILERRYTETT